MYQANVFLIAGDTDEGLLRAELREEFRNLERYWLQGPVPVGDAGAFVIEGVPPGRFYVWALIHTNEMDFDAIRTGHAAVETGSDDDVVAVEISLN